MAKREFTDYDAKTVKTAQALLIGITSPSGGGKTYSALRLATGIARVTGGEIYGIDTEGDRMLQYKNYFKFRWLSLRPPHNPLSYAAAIEHCLSKDAKIIIADSMTHEHSGIGGVLDMIDEYIERKAGTGKSEDYEAREKYRWAAQIRPKAERKHLNTLIEQVGSKCVFIFCYRASDKTKPTNGGKALHMGLQAETTSQLPYMMTIRFLLPPGSDGHPNLKPDTEFEKLSIKNPRQFQDWFRPGLQLDEDLGEKLARWSVEDYDPNYKLDVPPPPPKQKEKQQTTQKDVDQRLVEVVDKLKTLGKDKAAIVAWMDKVLGRKVTGVKSLTPDDISRLKEFCDLEVEATQSEQKTEPEPEPGSDG